MEPFTTLDAIAAAYPQANIDTDRIIPARFLKTVSKAGLGKFLFNDVRYHADGSEQVDFILNLEPWRDAQILIVGDNFGCGSSREHAPWALRDYGIRSLIAPGFADIFYNNCFKNGILPIVLDGDACDRLSQIVSAPERARMQVSLSDRVVRAADGTTFQFRIDASRAAALLEGRDDIASSMQRFERIKSFQEGLKVREPWISPISIGT